MVSDQPITVLLHAWHEGDNAALDDLFPLVYTELKRLARSRALADRDASLMASDLVHEAYLRLVKSDVDWNDRVHFYAVASRVMRRVLVDRARSRKRAKRGGGARKMTLDTERIGVTSRPEDLLDLDEALETLGEYDPRKAKAVELYYFGGMSYREMASFLGVSEATIHRDLRMARAWLKHQLKGKGPANGG